MELSIQIVPCLTGCTARTFTTLTLHSLLILQSTVVSAISETGQNAHNFVVRELRPEPGLVLTPPLLTVVQIVRGKLLKLKLARSEIVQVA